MNKEYDFEQFKLYRDIICIDFKSFYATVECNKRGLDSLNTPLIVSDESRGQGAITLAVTPHMKEKYGVKSRGRLWEIPSNIEGLIIAKPSMAEYVRVSSEIIKIYLRYVERNDIFIYSIDEVFIDLTSYLKLYKKTAYQMAIEIMQTIYREQKIYSTCGIGPNMLLAKYALDIESKHCKDWIAEWTYDDLETKLWPIKNMRDVWGIGRGKEKTLHRLGLTSIGDIAHCDVQTLIKEYGIIGEELFLHVHGIDISRIQDQNILRVQKSVGVGQTLFENYYNQDVLTVILEMCFELSLKLHQLQKNTTTISLTTGLDKKSNYSGFSKSRKLTNSSANYRVLYKLLAAIFRENYPKDIGVRRIAISFSGLTDRKYEQIDLFDNTIRDTGALDDVLVELRNKFGKDKIMLSVSNDEKATTKLRNKLIGGHNA